MEKGILGYKSFNENNKDISGKILEEGKSYHVNGKIKYGINGNGYHFAKNLEDTLRYQLKSNSKLVNPNIARVLGYGTILESNKVSDDYYGYYDSYVASDIKILKYLTREEIINYAINLSELRMRRFVSLYKLTDDEIKLFKDKYLYVDLALLYYQKQKLDIYQLYYKSWNSNQKSEKVKQLINKL